MLVSASPRKFQELQKDPAKEMSPFALDILSNKTKDKDTLHTPTESPTGANEANSVPPFPILLSLMTLAREESSCSGGMPSKLTLGQ